MLLLGRFSLVGSESPVTGQEMALLVYGIVFGITELYDVLYFILGRAGPPGSATLA